jgi:DinB family protein
MSAEGSTAPLSPREAAALLRASLEAIRVEAAAMTDRAASWHPKAGEWCAKEVLGHVIEADRRGFGGRIRQFLDAENPACVGWDPDEVARGRGDCGKPVAALLDELVTTRAEGLEVVEALTTAGLSRGGQHPKVGPLTVADILHEWVHHDRNHLKQMMTNVQAYTWPHMGNAQRFSTP